MPFHIVLVEDTKMNVLAFNRLLSKMIPTNCQELRNCITGMAAINHTEEHRIDLKNCETGMGAIKYIEEHCEEIDLVVLDGNLAPGLKPCSGPEVAAAILELNKKLDRKIPIATWTDDDQKKAEFARIFAQEDQESKEAQKDPTRHHTIKAKPCHQEDIQALMEFAKIIPRALCELPEVSASISSRQL